jgi:hypothetical protein
MKQTADMYLEKRLRMGGAILHPPPPLGSSTNVIIFIALGAGYTLINQGVSALTRENN